MTAQQIKPAFRNIEIPIKNRVSSNDSAQKQAILRFVAEKIAILKEDWDGYGGLPVEEKVLSNFENLLNNLPDNLVNSIDTDCILPNSNGTLSVDWSRDSDGIFLEIGNNYSTYYTKFNGKVDKINNQFNLSNPLELRQFMEDLKSFSN